MSYQQYKDPFTGEIDPTSILQISDDGVVTWVPVGNWRWDAYQQWLAEGHTPLPAA